ncbi:MAG: hypothetical protein ACK501_06800, partial [Planctomycetota bacterium]
PVLVTAAMAAHDLAPDDPRTLNLLGLATLRWRGNEGGEAAWRLWQQAAIADPAYVPAAANLLALAGTTGNDGLIHRARADFERRLAGPRWRDLDGLVLPFGFSALAVDRSLALQQAVRRDEPQVLAAALRG